MQENALRRAILERLRDLNRATQTTGKITGFDIAAAAKDIGVSEQDVMNALADFLTEGLIEPYAESMSQGATQGACRITARGLQTLRGE